MYKTLIILWTNQATGPTPMAELAHTDRIIAQGKALVRAIRALGIIEPSGPIERLPEFYR